MHPGVLVISHGSKEASWVTLVDEAAARLRIPDGMPIEVSFLEAVESRTIQDGIRHLEEQGATHLLVVPLFMSSGSIHVDEISYALGVKAAPDKETELEPFHITARVYLGSPVDDGLDVAQMVWDKVKELSVDPSREVVLLVGHGSIHDGFRQRWEQGISSLAASVREVSGTETDYALLNPESVHEKAAFWRKERGYDVIVAPLFLSSGYFTTHVIPERLAGLDCRYSGEALLPHPLLTSWMERQVQHLLLSADEQQA